MLSSIFTITLPCFNIVKTRISSVHGHTGNLAALFVEVHQHSPLAAAKKILLFLTFFFWPVCLVFYVFGVIIVVVSSLPLPLLLPLLFFLLDWSKVFIITSLLSLYLLHFYHLFLLLLFLHQFFTFGFHSAVDFSMWARPKN